MGITAGTIACFSDVSPRRQEALLYVAISILFVNTANAVLGEWFLYAVDMQKVLAEYPYQTLIQYGKTWNIRHRPRFRFWY